MKNILSLSFLREDIPVQGIGTRLIHRYYSYCRLNGTDYRVGRYEEIRLSDEARINLLKEISHVLVGGSIGSLEKVGKKLYATFIQSDLSNEVQEIDYDYLVIESNEYTIPWSILHDGENFLGLKKPLTFIPQTGISPSFHTGLRRLKALLILDPSNDPLLENAREEIDTIKNILDDENIEVHQIPNPDYPKIRLSELVSILEAGVYDILHFAGHGDYDAASDSSWLELFQGSRVYASDFNTIVFRHRPTIFLNACLSATSRSTPLSTALNTFAPKLFKQGAGIFIGTLAPIYDNDAKEFSIKFYTNFVKDRLTFGQSVFNSLRLLNYNRVSWSIYNCYGNPLLTFYRVKPEVKAISVRPTNGLTLVSNLIDKGVDWILECKELWIRDIHLTAKVLNLLNNVRPDKVETIPKTHLNWFEKRINSFLEVWLTGIPNRPLDLEEIGICSKCTELGKCVEYVENIVNGYVKSEIVDKVVSSLLRSIKSNYLWKQKGADGDDYVFASCIVLQFLSKHRQVFKKFSQQSLNHFLLKAINSIMTFQETDGSWQLPYEGKLEATLAKSNDAIHRTALVLGVMKYYCDRTGIKNKLIIDSMSRARDFIEHNKFVSKKDFWWNNSADWEDQCICKESDVRGTSNALIGLMYVENPFHETILRGIKYLIKAQHPEGWWPLDSSKVKNYPSITSTVYAVYCLDSWLRRVYTYPNFTPL